MTRFERAQAKGVQQGVLLAGVLGAALLLASMGRPDVQEVSFQHFRTHLLANGLVDHIEVSNKSTAKVFVRPGAQRCAPRAGVHVPLPPLVTAANSMLQGCCMEGVVKASGEGLSTKHGGSRNGCVSGFNQIILMSLDLALSFTCGRDGLAVT